MGDKLIFIDPDDDSEERGLSKFYPLWILLNFPPITNPLGDDGTWYGDGVQDLIPKIPAEMDDARMQISYLTLLELLSGLGTFDRKFVLEVMRRNMRFEVCTTETICISLLGTMPNNVKREMCRDAFSRDYLGDYLERLGKFILVRREILERVLGEVGEKIYDTYRTYLETKMEMMRDLIQDCPRERRR